MTAARLACSLSPALLVACSVPELGLRDGRLTPCPDSPNCVSSLAHDEAHRIEPFPLVKSVPETREGLRQIVAAMPRTTLLVEDEHYLRFQFTTLILRFKDDVEFHLVPAERLIHVRSASRVGYSDMGVNRKRVEELRRAYDRWVSDR